MRAVLQQVHPKHAWPRQQNLLLAYTWQQLTNARVLVLNQAQ